MVAIPNASTAVLAENIPKWDNPATGLPIVLRRSGSTVKTLRSPQHDLLLEELRRVRRHARMTQAALADKLGVAQSFVAKVETGERRLDVVEFIRWLDAADAFEDATVVLTRIRKASPDS